MEQEEGGGYCIVADINEGKLLVEQKELLGSEVNSSELAGKLGTRDR